MQKTIFKMQEKFIDKDKPEKYLNAEQRLKSLISFNENGQTISNNGVCLINQEMMFVMNAKNEIYAMPANLDFNHSYFFAGGEVIGAGFFITDENGRINYISNNSGHYCPSFEGMLYVIDYMFKKSSNLVDLVEFENHDKVQTEGSITTYSVRSLFDAIEENEDEDDFDLILEEVKITSQISHKTRPVYSNNGYEQNIDSANVILDTRFGCNPKGMAATCRLFNTPSMFNQTNKENNIAIFQPN